MKAGELAKISIFTPHECIPQKQSYSKSIFRHLDDYLTSVGMNPNESSVGT